MKSAGGDRATMEVMNSTGRKVSLLNDDPPAYLSHSRPSLGDHSRKSSCSTQRSREDSESPRHSSLASPAYSPRSSTPQLIRFNSTSSQGTLNSPSPMTPTYPFDPLEQNKNNIPQRDPYYRSNGPYYAPQPQESVQQPYFTVPNHRNHDQFLEDVYPSLAGPQQVQFSYPVPNGLPNLQVGPPLSPQAAIQTPVSATSASATPATPTSNSAKIGKKKYPCPHALRYSCNDTFTTSGHAARHGKKHTGEKNIFCPTCKKAFTRKDNMKQHERTHRSNTNRDANSDSPTITENSRQGKAPVSQPTTAGSTPMMASSMDLDDEGLELNSDGTMRAPRPNMRRSDIAESLRYNQPNSGLRLSIDTALAENSRPTFERTFTEGSQDGEGESPGLDALAMAASGMTG